MFKFDLRVLVVDDMLTMRKIVAKTLKDIGFSDIIDKPNGEEAWNFLQSSNPPVRIIVSDWNMPVMTGLDLLKKVRASEAHKKTPFLLVTAEGEQKQIIEAAKSGVDAYVAKPFTIDTLREKLSQVAQKYPDLKQ